MARNKYYGLILHDYTENFTVKHVNALTAESVPSMDLPITMEWKAGSMIAFKRAKDLEAWIAARPEDHQRTW